MTTPQLIFEFLDRHADGMWLLAMGVIVGLTTSIVAIASAWAQRKRGGPS